MPVARSLFVSYRLSRVGFANLAEEIKGARRKFLPEPKRRGGFRYESVLEFGESYARTLEEWRARFEAAWPEIEMLGFDDRFRRKWRYYLAYCEAGFLEGSIDVSLYRLTRA